MKIALLQVHLESGGGAANVQRINAAIDRAADIDSAPDLLVLPGGCDFSGPASKFRGGWAAMQGVRESIAFKAKEWGVYIIAGLHSSAGEELTPCSMLFDPDGDRLGQSLAAGTKESRVCNSIQSYATPMGLIGVSDITSDADLAGIGCDADGPAVVAFTVPKSLTASARRRAEGRIAELGSGHGVGAGPCWAVVASAESAPDGKPTGLQRSFVSDSTGHTIAEADHAGECIVYAELPVAESTL